MPTVKVDKSEVLNEYYGQLNTGALVRGLKTRVGDKFGVSGQRVGQIVKEHEEKMHNFPGVAVIDTDLPVGDPNRVTDLKGNPIKQQPTEDTIGPVDYGHRAHSMVDARKNWDQAAGKVREDEDWKRALSDMGETESKIEELVDSGQKPAPPPTLSDVKSTGIDIVDPEAWPADLEVQIQTQAEEIKKLQRVLIGHGLMIPACPVCGPDGHIIRHGTYGRDKNKQSQRYLCKNCDKMINVNPWN